MQSRILIFLLIILTVNLPKVYSAGSFENLKPLFKETYETKPADSKLKGYNEVKSFTYKNTPYTYAEFGRNENPQLEFSLPPNARNFTIQFVLFIMDSHDSEINTFEINDTQIEGFSTNVGSANVPSWLQTIANVENVNSIGYPDKFGKVELKFQLENGGKDLYYIPVNKNKIKINNFDGQKISFKMKNGLDEDKSNESFGIGDLEILTDGHTPILEFLPSVVQNLFPASISSSTKPPAASVAPLLQGMIRPTSYVSSGGLTPILRESYEAKPAEPKLKGYNEVKIFTYKNTPYAYAEFGRNEHPQLDFDLPSNARNFTMRFLLFMMDSHDNETNTLEINNTQIEEFRTYVWTAHVPSWLQTIANVENVNSIGYPDKFGKVELKFQLENGGKDLYYTSANNNKIKINNFDGRKISFKMKNGLDEDKSNESFGIGNLEVVADVAHGPSEYDVQLQDNFKNFKNDYTKLNDLFNQKVETTTQQFRDINNRFNDLDKALQLKEKQLQESINQSQTNAQKQAEKIQTLEAQVKTLEEINKQQADLNEHQRAALATLRNSVPKVKIVQIPVPPSSPLGYGREYASPTPYKDPRLQRRFYPSSMKGYSYSLGNPHLARQQNVKK